MTKKYFILITLFSLFTSSYGQLGKINKANKAYEKFAYINTSEVLLEVANKGYKSVEIFQKLGNSFYFNNKMEEAAKWYGELMLLNEEIDAEYYFRYAQALKSIENYSESDKWMSKFHTEKIEDLRGKAFSSSVDYLSKIDAASRDFELKNLDFNSELSDFGATHYKNQLIFSSSREGGGKIYKWNDQPFLELYTVTKKADGAYSQATKFNNDVLNTKYHESSTAFTSNDSILFFTRSNYYKKRLKKDSKGINHLKIFKAYLQSDNTWGNLEPVNINNDNYSVAHPTINAAGTKMYFASDSPMSIGLSDIFEVAINKDGTLGIPKNLGELINTEGQETFPFINTKGDLYFSTNGLPGLGGLDVYVIKDFEKKQATNTEFVVENIGKPINSSQDDFAYFENLKTNEGFITSNRANGKGDDDIYSFSLIQCSQVVNGIVKDKKTLEIIPNASVTLYDKEGIVVKTLTAGVDATFSFELDCEKEYLVRGQKDTYAPDEKRFTTPNTTQELNIDLLLEKNIEEVNEGTDLSFLLNPIYFDFDKDFIRPDAALELQKIIAILNQHPTMTIDVRSHTDSRAPFAYNDDLSSRRNKSTIKYIIEEGQIDSSRLTGRGYGERELVNKCADGVTCSEKEHDLNRRSEFIIIKM